MDPALFTPAAWPEEEEELDDEEVDEAIKKRLLFDCSETPMKRGDREASKKQSVVVFLRVRPKSQREILSMDADCFHLVGQRELQAVAPVTSQTFKNKAGVRCPSESSQLFSFTHIFDAQASQREVFEESMLPTLRDFFSGQNCLVFTYGVTNSGKTYTVTGTPTEPGVLPRSLDLIFNSISPQQLSSALLRPKNFSEATYLTEEETERELARKDDILNKARESSGVSGVEDTELTTDSDVSTLSKASSNFSKVSDEGSSLDDIQVQDGSTIELDDMSNICYSVWVSFTEIYNDFIYDLLGEEPKNRRSRPALKLAEDRNHNLFIKGLLEVQVSSVEEAMLLLKLGLQHRHVASTRLNYQSSRSHTVFTIKLIKMVNTERPHKALVNRISIVDLAGAERSMKTGATGMRVKEAGNINNSLLTLGKCIEAMRHNQNKRRGDEHVVPFRESKLTRLFQNYFVGKGKGLRQGRITMLVNVSNNASVFDETSHVLKFSALTSKVIPIVKSTTASHTTCSLLHPPTSSRRPATTAPLAGAAAVVPSETPRPGRRGKAAAVREDEDKTLEAKRTVPVTAAVTAPVAPCEECKLAKEEMARLKRKICDLEVEMMESEYNIRQEVCREFQEQLTEIEEAHRTELEEQAEDMQEMYEKRMQLLQKSIKKQFTRKRRRVGTEEDEEEEEGKRKGKGRAVEAHLREKVAELEEQLELEKNRGVAAAAELKDALETYESRVTRLNQQMNSLSLQLSEAGEQKKQLQEELTVVSEARDSLQERLAALTAEGERSNEQNRVIEEAAREREAELVASGERLQKQLEMANSKILELTKESESLGSERSSLVQEYEEREGRLRSEATGLRAELQEAARSGSKLTTQLEEVRREMVAAAGKHAESVQSAEERREDAVAEVEILQARISELTRERSSVEAELVELKQPSSDGDLPTQTPSASSTSAAELSHQMQGLQAQLMERDTEIAALRQADDADTNRTREEYQEKLCSLREELTSVREELSATRRELTEDSQRHGQQLQSVLCDEASKQEALHGDLTSAQAQLAAQQELLYKLEIELEEKETGMEHQLAAKSGEVQALWGRVREKDDLIGSLQNALREVEVMLESQTAKIGDMNGELEDVHSSNEALQERLVCLEGRLTTSRAEKCSLSTRVEGLTAQVEEGRKMLAQREAELLSSADQCRTILEQQLADMRSAHSSAQQELARAREEARTLQQQFREKESELLALATSSSEDKTAAVSLSTELQSLRETLEKRESEHSAQLKALQGNHQLETSQLRIRVRELVEVEEALQKTHGEEVAQWCEQVDTLTVEAKKRAAKLALHEQEEKKRKKSVRDLEGEKRTSRKLIRELEEKVTSLEQQLESLRQERERERERVKEEPTEDSHIYEDPSELSDEPTVYENDSHSLSSTVLQSVENKPDRTSAHLPHSDSKPFIAILERSSQLVEDTFTEEPPRTIIDATPPAGRRGRRAKKPKKRSIEEVARGESGVTPDTKRVKYQLRSRKKHQRFPEDGGENQMPEDQTPVRKAPSLRNLISKSTKKIVALTMRPPSPQPAAAASSPPASGPALRSTRRTYRAIRKSQISMPLGLMNSPGPGPKRAIRLRRHQVQPGREI